MSCEMDRVKIIKGSDHTIRAELKNCDGSAFDLTGVDEITAAFPLQAGTYGNLTLTDGKVSIVFPPELGALIITLDDTFTGTLKTGEAQTFEIKIDNGTQTSKVQFTEILDVIASKT